MHAGRNPHPTRREIRRSEVGQAPTPSNYYFYYYYNYYNNYYYYYY